MATENLSQIDWQFTVTREEEKWLKDLLGPPQHTSDVLVSVDPGDIQPLGPVPLEILPPENDQPQSHSPENSFFEKHNVLNRLTDDRDEGDLPDSSSRKKREAQGQTSSQREMSALKYNRMRELNNLASQRSRRNLKLKRELMQKELEDQEFRRLLLERKCQDLESKTVKLKSYILKYFKNPSKDIYLARQRLVFGKTINSDILYFEQKAAPDISSLWSNIS